MRRRTDAGRRSLAGVLLAALVGALLMAVPQAAPAHADAAGKGGNFVKFATDVRVLDTRNAVGVATTSAVGAGGTTAAFPVTGVGGIPATGVTGVMATVFAYGASTSTAIAVYPDAASPPAGVSTVHVKGGTGGTPNFSNTITTPLSSAGKLRASNSAGTTHIIVDVQGYFTSSNTTGAGYVPVTQTRAVDSRSNVGTTGGKLAAGASRTITLPSAVIPTTASAVYFNLLVPTATKAGGLFASATGTGGTAFAYAAGSSSSGLSVKLNAGKLVLSNTSTSDPADFVIDLQGYWTNSPSTGAGYRPAPATGTLIDTIPFDSQMPAGSTYNFRAAGFGSIPTQGVAGVLVNIHVRNQATNSTNFKAWPSGATEPATSVNNNPGDGETRDSLNIVKPGVNGRISIKNNGSVQSDVYVQIEGWFADPLPTLPITSGAKLTGLQRAGAAGSVRPIDFAFTTSAGWLEVGRIPDPSTLSVDETTYQLLSGGDTFTQTPSLTEGSTGKLTVVGHNTDSNVWTKTENTAGSAAYPAPWTQQGGSPTGPPTTARLSDGRQVMVAVDSNGALWSSLTPTAGGAFDAWRFTGGVNLTGEVSIVPNSSGTSTLFARNTSGNIVSGDLVFIPSEVHTGEWNDNPSLTVLFWNNQGNPGTALDATGTPTVVANGDRRRLFVRKSDGTIWTKAYDGTNWGAWSQIAGQSAAAGQPTAILHPNNNTYQVLVRTSTGSLAWASEVSANSGTWTTWKNTYAGVATDPFSLAWSYADNTKGWSVLFSDTAGHNVIGNFSTAVPPNPAAGKATAKSTGKSADQKAPHFTVLKTPK